MIDLTGIIAISGQPGLYKVVAQSKNGIIVEGLADKKRTSISSTAKVSSLEDISMFTTGDDKPVSEIMKAIYDKEKGGPSIDVKADDKSVTAYFESVLPDYDKERVYTSNMRKLFNWYNGLQTSGNLKVKEKETEATEESAEKKIVKAATEKKAAVKKTAAKDTTKTKTSTGVKKTAGVRKTGVA
ncbi:MAG: hypothetical protein K0R26_123 [Bacteroidota bacterium]|jgi:hypothetical protein|nr:hypothetical protein [Bacteroidota bacterium]